MSQSDPVADQQAAQAVVHQHSAPAAENTSSSGSGCGGDGCACGGDVPTAADGEVQPLTIDPRLDVRKLPHGERHARVLAALDALPADAALVLIAPHAPLPLLAEIETRYAGQVAGEWLQDGPTVWQIRLHRQPVLA